MRKSGGGSVATRPHGSFRACLADVVCTSIGHESAVRSGGSAMPLRSGRAEYVHLTMPASPENLYRLRHAMAGYLGALPLEPDRRDEIVLAVGEAAANAVEHAYTDEPEPGPLEVTFWTDSDAIWVEVRDHGRWREPPPAPRAPGPGSGHRADAPPDRLRPHPARSPRHQCAPASPRRPARSGSCTGTLRRSPTPNRGRTPGVIAVGLPRADPGCTGFQRRCLLSPWTKVLCGPRVVTDHQRPGRRRIRPRPTPRSRSSAGATRY